MKALAIFMLFPAMGVAQSFAPPPDLGQDGVTFDAGIVDACISDLLADGIAALVAEDARDCIGSAASQCRADNDETICATLERNYWDWRLAQSFQGLAVWADAEASPALKETLLPLYSNPDMATGHLMLECDIRINRIAQSKTPDVDIAQCLLTETALIALEAEFALRGACARGGEGSFASYCKEIAE